MADSSDPADRLGSGADRLGGETVWGQARQGWRRAASETMWRCCDSPHGPKPKEGRGQFFRTCRSSLDLRRTSSPDAASTVGGGGGAGAASPSASHRRYLAQRRCRHRRRRQRVLSAASAAARRPHRAPPPATPVEGGPLQRAARCSWRRFGHRNGR